MSHVYSIDDFAEFEKRGKALAKGVKVREAKPFNDVLPPSVQALLRPKREKLWERWNGDTTGLTDPSPSGVDQSIANLLALKEIDETDIIHALKFRRAQAGLDLKYEGYYAQTVGNALAWVKEQKKPARKLKAVPDLPSDSDIPLEDAADSSTPLEDNTDAGHAAAFIRYYGADLRYVPAMGLWLVWDGTRWRRDDGNEVRRLMGETSVALIYEAADEQDPARREKLFKMALGCRSARAQRDALWIAESNPAITIRADQLDTDLMLLNCVNGTVDLRTGKLRKHRREDYITRVTSVPYDRKAKAPTWDKFNKEVLPDPKVRAFMNRAWGYTLTGDTREEVMFFVYGGGLNGKTTEMEAVRACFGPDYAVELPSNAMTLNKNGDEPERALVSLEGARLATMMELRENQPYNVQYMKKVTSGEPIRVRCLYKESYEITPVAKVWTATNYKPRIVVDDDGTWRRIMLIPFDQKIAPENVNRNLARELREELPGILTGMVKGCLAWQKQGLNPPESVLAATREYRSDEDWLTEFLEECTETSPKSWVSAADICAVCEHWFKRSGGARAPSSKAIAARLKQRGFVPKKRCHKRGWPGFKLTSEAQGWLRLDPTRRVSALVEKETK